MGHLGKGGRGRLLCANGGLVSASRGEVDAGIKRSAGTGLRPLSFNPPSPSPPTLSPPSSHEPRPGRKLEVKPDADWRATGLQEFWQRGSWSSMCGGRTGRGGPLLAPLLPSTACYGTRCVFVLFFSSCFFLFFIFIGRGLEKIS